MGQSVLIPGKDICTKRAAVFVGDS